MSNKPRIRQWAFVSHGAEAGKSTFLGSNAIPPLMVVDADNRFDAVESLNPGPVLYATQVFNTLDLAEELIKRVPKEGVKSLLWDSLTKIYSLPNRMGLMKNIQKKAEGGNRASSFVDKSNAMTLARDLVVLGPHVYFCWHTTSGVDGAGKSEIRDMISDIEKERLMTSINVVLEFFYKGPADDRSYGVRVVSARDFAGRRANVGFELWDEVGYWRGGADLLEKLIYTPFDSREGAISWAAEALKMEIDEVEGEYDHFKETERPDNSGQMFSGWYLRVKELKETWKGKTQPGPETKAKVIDVLKISGEEAGDHEPKVGAGEYITRDGAAEDSLAALGDLKEATIGNVVFAAATAWPERFSADQALVALRGYPELPENAEVKMDRMVTTGTALKMFDWLKDLEVELT